MRKMTKKPLTPKQEVFVREYLIDLNATKAAERAGYSKRTAYSQSHDLLKKPEIQAAIAGRMCDRAARLDLSADAALDGLGIIGFSDLRQYYDDDGTLKPVAEWSERMAAAIASMDILKRIPNNGKEGSEEVVKIRFWDKLRALELLGKHLGHFTNKVEVELNMDSIIERLERGRMRNAMQRTSGESR